MELLLIDVVAAPRAVEAPQVAWDHLDPLLVVRVEEEEAVPQLLCLFLAQPLELFVLFETW